MPAKLEKYEKKKLSPIIRRSILFRHLHKADKENKFIELDPQYTTIDLTLRHNQDLENLMDKLAHWNVDELPNQVFIYMFIFVYSSVNKYRIKEDQEYFCHFFDKYKDFALVEQLRIFMHDYDDVKFINRAIQNDQTDLVEFFNDLKLLSVDLSENLHAHYLDAASHGRLYFVHYLHQEQNQEFNGYDEIIASAQHGHLECLKYFMIYHKMYAFSFEEACQKAYDKAKQFGHEDCAKELESHLPQRHYVNPFTNSYSSNYQQNYDSAYGDLYEDLPYANDLPVEEGSFDDDVYDEVDDNDYYQQTDYYGDL